MDKVIISGKQVGNRVEEIKLSPAIEQSEMLNVNFGANEEIELIIPIKKMRELLQQIYPFEIVEELLQHWQRMTQEAFKGLEQLAELAEAYEKKILTPCELKRKLKYAKNPMEIKKLNKQLTEAYKVYGKKVRTYEHNNKSRK